MACGELNGNPGADEVVCVPGRGTGSHFRKWRYANGTWNPIGGWRAFTSTWRGGLYVSVGNVCSSGLDEIVVGAGRPGAPHIRVFEWDGTVLNGFIRGYTTHTKSGIRVAVGDVDLSSPPMPGERPVREWDPENEVEQHQSLKSDR